MALPAQRHPSPGQSLAKLGGASGGGQAGQFAPQRLDLRRPVQPQHPPEVLRRILLQIFRAFDAPQRHQQQREQTGAQSIEARPETAVDFLRALEHPLAIKTGRARRTPARGTAVAEPNSGGASSSNPKRASNRSAERSLGSVSWLAGALVSAAAQKADSFGFDGRRRSKGSDLAVGSLPSHPASNLRTAVSLIPSRRAISQWDALAF